MLRISGVGGYSIKGRCFFQLHGLTVSSFICIHLTIYLFNIFRLCEGFEDIGLSVIHRPDRKSDAICQTIDEGYQTTDLTL